MLPLPVGTERVYSRGGYGDTVEAYPGEEVHYGGGNWSDSGIASSESWWENRGFTCYHVPQPAPADKPDPLDQLAAEAQAEGEDAAPYGYCPRCDAKGVNRERRINGNDKCENGHCYPSAHAASRPISRSNIPQSLRSVYQFTVNRMMHCMLNRHYDEGRFLEGLLNVLESDYPTLAHREGRAIREVPR